MKIPLKRMSNEQLGVGGLQLSAYAKRLVNEVLDSNRLSYGPYHKRLESMFAKEHGVRFSLFTNSGTSALQLAISALKNKYGWKDGDEVIVPAVTFVATANIVLLANLKPVFVDVELTTFNIDPALIEQAITERTRCIIPVHLLGLPASMGPILEIAKKYDLKVIEDSCETMFAKYRGQSVGSMGHIGCFSTYVAHFLVTGVGGFSTTNDSDLHISMRSLMNHGRDSIYLSIDDDHNLSPDALSEVVGRRFNFVQVGYSYRCTEMEAALGIAQLEEKDHIVRSRRKNARYLTERLSTLQNHLQLPAEFPDRDHAYMLYGVVLKKGSKHDLVSFLERHGLETRDLLPLVNQPIYKSLYGDDLEDRFPVAKHLNHQAFYIGCHQYLSREDLDYIADLFFQYFEQTTPS